MDPQRMFKCLMIVSVLFVGAAIALAAASDPDRTSGTTRPPATSDLAQPSGATRPPANSGYSHDDLQRDAEMTQRMSMPNANTGSQVHAGDAQLQHSQSAGYVAALEQHQADIDQMLAREAP